MPYQAFYKGDTVQVQGEMCLWTVNLLCVTGKHLELRSIRLHSTYLKVFPIAQIKLKSRGHHYRYELGLPMEFGSLRDGMSFWNERKAARILLNPELPLRNFWHSAQAVSALQQGSADGFYPTDANPAIFFGYALSNEVPTEAVEYTRQWCLQILEQQAKAA